MNRIGSEHGDERVPTQRVVIMVVAGGDDPQRTSWLEVCLSAIDAHTSVDHEILLWNNDVGDLAVANTASRFGRCRQVDAPSGVALRHPHAEGLQQLYEVARDEGATHVVTMDTDAFPIRDGWLDEMLSALDRGAALAGIWHDERSDFIEPYVHPSCLGTTVEFIEANGLRFDELTPEHFDGSEDTLSMFTRAAIATNRSIHRWRRSNRRELHWLYGGVYGDAVYHHGAGSRRFFPLHTQDARGAVREREVADLGATMCFERRDEYLSWLRGSGVADVLYVLGMHRSGTSCLTACLEACGGQLGRVERRSFDQPAGTLEERRVVAANDALLSARGGSWQEPVAVSAAGGPTAAETDAMIDDVLAAKGDGAPLLVKDPRLLFTLDAWLDRTPHPGLVGTFRHPLAVAKSLWERDRIPIEQGLEMWRRSAEQLLALQSRHDVPLVEFDLDDPEAYCRHVAGVAATLGLSPRLAAIRPVVHRASRRTAIAPSDPIPPACAELYDRLRAAAAPPVPESRFEQLLCEWGELVDAPVDVSLRRDFELWAWNVARHLPRPLRTATRPVRRLARWLRLRREHGAARRTG